MAKFLDLRDNDEKSLLKSVIRSNKYPHVLAADSGYWQRHLASANGVLYFSGVGTPDMYALRFVNAKEKEIHLKSGVISLTVDLWEGDNPFPDESTLLRSGATVTDTKGPPHAELDGANLAAGTFARDRHLESFILCIDNEGVFTALKNKSYNRSNKLNTKMLDSVRETASDLGGTIALVESKDLIICDRLNKVPLNKSDKESVMNAYHHIRRRYSTQSGDSSPETARVLVLRTKELDQEIFKYVKEGKVTLGYYPRIPSVGCFEGDESTKEQMLQLAEIFQRIGDKLQLYVRLPQAPTLGNERSETIDAILLLRYKVRHISEKGIITTRLLVPYMVGCLLGQGGTVINEIRRMTQADIHVYSKDEKPECASKDEELVQMSASFPVAKDALAERASRLRARTLRDGNAAAEPAPPSPRPVDGYGSTGGFHRGGPPLPGLVGLGSGSYNPVKVGMHDYEPRSCPVQTSASRYPYLNSSIDTRYYNSRRNSTPGTGGNFYATTPGVHGFWKNSSFWMVALRRAIRHV